MTPAPSPTAFDRADLAHLPLITFVHIPKTAGTTVNKVLGLCSHRGQAHTPLDANFSLLARNCDWLSSHLTRDQFTEAMHWVDRPIEYYTVVREPSAHIVSYLNFQFEVLRTHPLYISTADVESLKFVSDVVATDFTNPYAIINLILRHMDVLMNLQSRCVLGLDHGVISEAEIQGRLRGYKYIATEHDLPKLFEAFGFAQLPSGLGDLRENVANTHFDKRIFFEGPVQEFLTHYNAQDYRLYDTIRNKNWISPERAPFRPVFRDGDVFTQENFDEEYYLACFPEVENLVLTGRENSGLSHFLKYGLAEGRRMKLAVWPRATPEPAPAPPKSGLVSRLRARLGHLESPGAAAF